MKVDSAKRYAIIGTLLIFIGIAGATDFATYYERDYDVDENCDDYDDLLESSILISDWADELESHEFERNEADNLLTKAAFTDSTIESYGFDMGSWKS